MSKFDEIVRNIALENEKCNYNPEKDTNWSKLSWEMRRECREHMDFKTKNCLRQTGKEEKSNLSYILKFRYVVQNIALESEKSNYNPGKDTNWDILPMEMRLECRFRRVSKLEKSLVDSKKYRFKCFKLMFDHDHGRWDIAVKTGDGLRHEFWRENKHPDFVLISAILRHAEVENFFFMAEDCLGTAVPPVLEQLEKLAPFPFKRVLMDANLLFIFFLRHCPNLEKVDFTGTDEFSQFLLDMILDVPTVMNIKEFRFSQPSGPEFPKFLKELVQKWIDNEAEVGKSIQFELQTEGILNTFFGEFANRIIDKTDEKVRIRMDNGTKQILFRQIGSRVQRRLYMQPREVLIEYCSCKVVPIDMPESEYPTGDGWIQAVYEQALQCDGKLKTAKEFDIEDQVWR